MPSCEVHNRWAVDVNTPKGQSMMALILTAYSQGKNVSISGTGECSDAGDTEGIEYVLIN
jgi:phosphotransferase system HPr-like phosphotransfer protein